MKSYQTYRSWETSARVVITKIWFRILIRPKRFGLTTKEKQNGKQQGMKIYRTYRYGELPYMCICNNANKRDKETKRMSTRWWAIHKAKQHLEMRKGNEI